MKKKSLRQIAKELGVSPSYLSQVKNGKRKPSEKVLSKSHLFINQSVKQTGYCFGDKISRIITIVSSQRGSAVEQRFRKPPVASSILAAGSILHKIFSRLIRFTTSCCS